MKGDLLLPPLVGKWKQRSLVWWWSLGKMRCHDGDDESKFTRRYGVKHNDLKFLLWQDECCLCSAVTLRARGRDLIREERKKIILSYYTNSYIYTYVVKK